MDLKGDNHFFGTPTGHGIPAGVSFSVGNVMGTK